MIILHPPPPQVLHVGAPEDEQEALEVEVTRLLVRSYFDVVRGNLQDMVPKAVMHFLVAQVQRNLHQHLIQKLVSALGCGGGMMDIVEAKCDLQACCLFLNTRTFRPFLYSFLSCPSLE